MKVLVILPNWLGDAVMATPAIEAFVQEYPQCELTLIGSYVSIEALKHHPNCIRSIIDETKKSFSRLLATYKLAKSLPEFDVALTFRDQIHSSLLLYFLQVKKTIARQSWHASLLLSQSLFLNREEHLVQQYHHLVTTLIGVESLPSRLKLYIPAETTSKKLLGVNAGATYGAAKRWYPERFAEVAAHFSADYDIVIFGGPNEVEMAQAIENELVKLNIKNYDNVAGKTDIKTLCAKIASLSLFVTNDSGPMHVAAAYQVPTVSVFGPTRHHETSQWMNENSSIVRKDVACAPCMKRECPLPSSSSEYHQCMKKISSEDVIQDIIKLLK